MVPMCNTSTDTVSGAVLRRVVGAVQIELPFILVFGLLYLFGRSAHARTGKGKGKSPAQRPLDISAAVQERPVHLRAPATGRAGGAPPALAAGDARHPTRLVPEVLQLCRERPKRALAAYRAARHAGLDLRELVAAECQELFAALVAAAIRSGCAEEALGLVRELRAQGPGVGPGILASAAKLCTSRQQFAECLAIYDGSADDPSVLVDDKSVWSCLLFSAVETKCYNRCPFFFQHLRAAGQPSAKDYGNMLRCAAAGADYEASLRLVREMRKAGIEIDNVMYNTALSTCVDADQLDQASILLEEMERVGGKADVITYNTLSKGYAKAGRMDRCFEGFQHMCKQGIRPSQFTYGILLEGYVNSNEVDWAKVYDRMVCEGCPMNTVLYTTLIKGFVRAEQLDQAMQVYKQMCSDQTVAPDLVTFGILIKANCDRNRLDAALHLFKAMSEVDLSPDEIIYNNLIDGCVAESRTEVAKQLYKDMVEAAVRPSNATFSILIRLYTQSKRFDEAWDILKSEPRAHGISPEPRLFLQFINPCLRDRRGRRAVEAYKLMLEYCRPTAAANGSVLGICVKLNMLDTGAEILGIIAETKGQVNAADAAGLVEASTRKRKLDCAATCSRAIAELGLLPSRSCEPK